MILVRPAALPLIAVSCLLGCQRTQAAPDFPQVDRDKLVISLTRSGCFGTCPDYKVTIDGRGHVVFTTEGSPLEGAPGVHHRFATSSYVVAPGRHEDQIDLKAVDGLVDKFRNGRFFVSKDEYSAQITDNPTYVVEIDTGHGRKKVLDYVGREVGMPETVTQLEDAIDGVAGTARWVSGANGLPESLERERFDFHSPAASQMLLAAVEYGSDKTLLDFVKRGAPLQRSAGKVMFGSLVLLAAIEDGRAPLFRALVERGWLDRTNRQDVNSSFASAGGGCSPDLIDAAIAAGIPVDAVTGRDYDQGMDSDGAETALASLSRPYLCRKDADTIAAAQRLVAHGANPNARDKKGETPLYGIENKDLLEWLLAHGAYADVVDKDGNSPVFGSWTDEIVLRLLQAGASPKGHYDDGKTLIEQMKERPMPKSKAWLDAHPEKLALAKLK